MPNIETATTELVSEDQLDINTVPSLTAITIIFGSDDPLSELRSSLPSLKTVDEVVVLAVGPRCPPPDLSRQIEDAMKVEPLTRSVGNNLQSLNCPNCIVADLSHETYPHLYQLDSPETYTSGDALAGETPSIATCGLPMVSNWAYVYELGLALASSEWSMFHRPGETIHHADLVKSACLYLSQNGRSSARVPHTTPWQSRYRTLLVRNCSGISFDGKAVPESSGTPTILDGSISSTTNNDSSRVDTVKILCQATRRARSSLRPFELAQLSAASLSGHDSELPLALAASDACLSITEDPEVAGWATALRGEWYFRGEHYRMASSWFEKSIHLYPNWKSALRLSRSQFMVKNWRGCLESYELAQTLHGKKILLHDDGRFDFDRSLIFVTSAMDKLGMKTDSRSARDALTKIFPNHPAVTELAKSIGKAMLRGERLAITTGSMNRLQHLRLALETWTKLPEPDKIIVVDWGSSDPLHSALSSFTDERITFVRAEQTTWQNSRCHNLEFAAASRLECDLVLRLDNDTLVDPSFFDHHPIDDTSFYAVNCHTVPREVDDKRNLCGTVFVATRHWRRVNGYNERLTRYGYEDEDFYGRLSSQRLSWRECQLEDLEHIPHSDESRLANLPASSTLSSVSLEVAKQFHITLSRQISVERPWSPDDHITPWIISPSNNSDRLLIASV